MTYGGTPSVLHSASSIAVDPLRAWSLGVDGFVRWLTVSPGADPWFKFEGGTETLVYSGERFGIESPIPSIRLKLQRNCLQDIALLQMKEANNQTPVRKKILSLFLGHPMISEKSVVAPQGDVIDWSNADIDDALHVYEHQFDDTRADAWEKIHRIAIGKEVLP